MDSDVVAEALRAAVDAAGAATDCNGCVPPSMEDRVAAAIAAFLHRMAESGGLSDKSALLVRALADMVEQRAAREVLRDE